MKLANSTFSARQSNSGSPGAPEGTVPAGTSERVPARYVSVRPFIVRVISPLKMSALSSWGACDRDQTPLVHPAKRRCEKTLRVSVVPPAPFLSCAYSTRVCFFLRSLLLYFLASFLQKRRRPSRSDGGCREKGVPSSGEKIGYFKESAHERSQLSEGGGGPWLRRIAPRGPRSGGPCVTV